MGKSFEIEYTSDEDIEAPLTGNVKTSYKKSSSHSTWLVAYASIASLLLCGCLGLLAVTYLSRSSSELECAAQTSAYSPLMDAVEYTELNFNNSFLHKSVYRGPPTNELEAAWERLWNHDLIAVPEDKFSLLHKSTDKNWMRVPSEKGGGYAANIEVFHQLHCLNLIRQYTWGGFYARHPDRVDNPIDMADNKIGLRVHVDHCIETLRLGLMCHGDVTPYLVFYDGEDDDLGEADFNPHHKCRNFDKIKDEMVKRAVIQRWPGGNRQWTKGEEDIQ